MNAQLIIFSVLPLFFFSCRYDHADDPELFPPQCDSLNPSYANCVKPLLEAHCYSCHSHTASNYGQLGLDLEDFSALKNYLNTMHYRGDSIYGSKFEAEIEQRILVLSMPPTSKLQQGEIDVIERWIGAGAPGN